MTRNMRQSETADQPLSKSVCYLHDKMDSNAFDFVTLCLIG